MKLPPEHFRVQAEQKQAEEKQARFGERLMQQMGWAKGQGLGKDGKGRKEHIRVKKKETLEGVSELAERVLSIQHWACIQLAKPHRPFHAPGRGRRRVELGCEVVGAGV